MALFKILRGNSSKLIKSNGAINPETKWTDGYAYYCTDTHDFYIDHLDSKGTQVRSKLNAKEAEKLRTSRSIAVGEAVTSTATGFDGSADITIPINSVKEAYLTWGGKNLAASYGPIDAAMIPELGANRFAYIKEEAIKVEYSKDGGSTWTESTSTYKHRIFGTGGSNWTIGGDATTNIDKSQWQIRITITASKAPVYTELNKFAIYGSTNGSTGCWCTVRGRLKSKVEAGEDTWKIFAEQAEINGWPGWNIINVNKFTSYGNPSNKTIQYEEIQFIFGVTRHLSTSNYQGLYITKIMGFGGVGWATPSTLAKTGNLYSQDNLQNATFPAKVTATTLASTGNATVAGTLSVTGASTLSGAVTAKGNLTVKGNTTLGDAYSDTVFAKGTVTIGDNGRTYAQAQTHTLYGGLEMYKGYMYLESIDSQGYFYVDAENRGYTEISGMPLKLIGANATLTVDGISQFNDKITIGDSNDKTNTNILLDVYGEIASNALHVCDGAGIDGDIDVGGVLYVNGVNGGVNSIEAVGGIYSRDNLSTGGMLYVGNEANLNIVNVTGVLSSTNEIYTTNSVIYALSSDNTHGATLDATGYVYATDYMEAPEFIGDLTGTADEAYSLTWAYFNDSGTIS